MGCTSGLHLLRAGCDRPEVSPHIVDGFGMGRSSQSYTGLVRGGQEGTCGICQADEPVAVP